MKEEDNDEGKEEEEKDRPLWVREVTGRIGSVQVGAGLGWAGLGGAGRGGAGVA